MADNEKTEKVEQTEQKSALDVLTEGMNNLFKEEEVVETKEEKQSEGEDTDLQKELDEDLGESEDEPKEKEAEAESSDSDDTEPIPQDQVDMARKLGFSDEEIVKIAETNPERLENMVKLYSKPEPTQRETTPVAVAKREEPKKEVTKLEHVQMDDLDNLEPESAKVVQGILKAHNQLIDAFNKQQEKLDSVGEQTVAITEKERKDAVGKIDSFFDEASEHVPELGKVSNLTQEQAKTRSEIYGLAVVMQQSRGISEREALEQATYLWGLSKIDLSKLEVEAEERLKEKLNKQKRTMSPRPGGKKKAEQVTKGKDAAQKFLADGMKELFGN